MQLCVCSFFRIRKRSVISRVAKAVKILIDKGILNAEDFPLLLHADEILTEKKPVELPWEKFAFRDF